MLGLVVVLLVVMTVMSFVACGVVDVCWVGTSLDRAGTAVCLVWLILFEGVFFFGAVWCLGLLVDCQGHSVGLWGGSADAGVAGLGGAEMSAVLGAGSEVPGSIGLGSLGGFGGQVVVSSGESVGVLGMVLLPVMGSLLVLLAVSLILQ